MQASGDEMQDAKPNSAEGRGQDRVFRITGTFNSALPPHSVFGAVLFCSGCYNNTIGWDLKCRTFISHSSGGWKPKIKVPADSTPGESPLLGL